MSSATPPTDPVNADLDLLKRTIFVGNLPGDVKERDLRRNFEAVCEDDVTDVRIALCREQSRTFAFLTLSKQTSVDKAISGMHRKKMGDIAGTISHSTVILFRQDPRSRSRLWYGAHECQGVPPGHPRPNHIRLDNLVISRLVFKLSRSTNVIGPMAAKIARRRPRRLGMVAANAFTSGVDLALRNAEADPNAM
ncbi:hypothetical protein FRC04_005646 [Tulasnella sp. 424]|nr:hypothetical protein FRC04_005646 [Tulasnella sp. 424]